MQYTLLINKGVYCDDLHIHRKKMVFIHDILWLSCFILYKFSNQHFDRE